MAEPYASAQPPAKRVCLEGPSHPALELERPSTPVDDGDDDFYDATPIKPLSPRVGVTQASSSDVAAVESALPSGQIPGLGLNQSSEKPTFPSLIQKNIDEQNDAGDADSLYNGQGPEEEGLSKPAPLDSGHHTTLVKSEPPEDLANTMPADVAKDMALGLKEETDDGTKSLALDSKADFLLAGEANKDNQNAEWQLDSSDDDTSSDNSSDDSSDDSSSEDEDGLLGPEEQARILMQADLDEDGGTGEGSTLRTKNESEEKFEKPDVKVTVDMEITELGNVEVVVDNMVLIKANVTGEYRVLETGSVLCLGDRTVIGAVSETLGRVQEPRYVVGFSDPAEIPASGIQKDTTVFYVNQHSTFVFTEPLQGLKGTDASNMHDEELGANEIEFSDDEAEAEYKRNLKQARKAKAVDRREAARKGDQDGSVDVPATSPNEQYGGGGLNYSDDEDMGMYKPLARPDHFEDVVGAGAPIEDRSHVRRGNMRPSRGWVDRGRGRGRGGSGNRGDRGRGGGMRGDRGGRYPHPSDRRGRPQDRGRHEHSRQENRYRSSRSPSQHHFSPQRHAPAANANAQPSYPTAPTNSQSHTWNQNSWPLANNQSAQHPQGPASPGGSLPAGAFVNPSFFPQQPAPASSPPQWPAAPQPNWAALAQLFQTASQNQPNPAPTGNTQASDPQAAFRLAQQQIDLLRSLNRGPGSQ